MYLVVMKFIFENTITPIVVCETREKAQEYIDMEMNGKEYNGTGLFKIIEVEKY